MKRLILTILLLFIILLCHSAKAPELNALIVIKPRAIDKYGPLIEAITWVESRHGKYTWNPVEEAIGWFQIRPIRVEDYNKRTGKNYKPEDFINYDLSKKMFLFYADGKTYEHAAKDWNGSGKKTIEYWKLVKQRLNETNARI